MGNGSIGPAWLYLLLCTATGIELGTFVNWPNVYLGGLILFQILWIASIGYAILRHNYSFD